MRGLPDSVGIKGLGGPELEGLMSDLGQPGYRVSQLRGWLYGHGVDSYDEMTNMPTTLRERLELVAPLYTPTLVTSQTSAVDGTRKYLWRLADGSSVESVGLPSGDRLTVCFSTQAGCAMGCSFCATGHGGLVRDLGPGEMVDQVRLTAQDFGRRATNAVAMGQGEPFANYEHTLAALRFMNDKDGLNIGARHLTVSTCGLVEGIRRFAEEPEQFTLAISLHSAIQATRDRIMPGVRGQRLESLHTAIADYGQATGRRPSIEFALIEGVNDSDDELRALVEFCRGLHVHVNLIPVNPVEVARVSRSDVGRLVEFKRALVSTGTEVTVRQERGVDIDAACGQLRQRHE